MKYRGEYARAKWHGTQIAGLISDSDWAADILAPVPLHPNRLRQRRFNQAQKLAESAALTLDLKVVHAIARNRDTSQQTTLGFDERRRNVKGAFRPVLSLGGMSVVLIDDVTTTGSTLLECAQVCWAAGADTVRAATLATDV